MASSKVIYLVRHGKIQTGGDQRCYIGQSDLPLTEEGVRQAERMRERLVQTGVKAVYCSDLERSVKTARILAQNSGYPVIVRPELREVSLGEWEGLSFAEVIRHYHDKFEARGADIAYYRIPGGESFVDCSQRVLRIFHQIVTEMEDSVAIVGHAGVNRLILCNLLGMPIANLFRIAQDYACINTIHYNGTIAQVKLVNSIVR